MQHLLDYRPDRRPAAFANFEPCGYFYQLMGKEVTHEDFYAFFSRLETELQIKGNLPYNLTMEKARQQFSEYTEWKHLNERVFHNDYPEFLLSNAMDGVTVIPIGHSINGLYQAAGTFCSPNTMLNYWQNAQLTPNVEEFYLDACNTGSEIPSGSSSQEQEAAKKAALSSPFMKRPFALRVKSRIKRKRFHFNPEAKIRGTVGFQVRFPDLAIQEAAKDNEALLKHGFKKLARTGKAKNNLNYISEPFIVATPPASPTYVPTGDTNITS